MPRQGPPSLKRRLRYDPTGTALEPRSLTPAERRFCDELLIDCDPGEAALRAGYKKREDGSRLLARPKIHSAVMARFRGRMTRVQIEHDYILKRWLLLESADPRELAEHWRVPCRYCWGIDHQYQYTSIEMRVAQQEHRLQYANVEVPPLFDELGGDGYTINRAPMRGSDYVLAHPDKVANSDHTCPAHPCHGDGTPHLIFHDTRNLSEAAALLYKGLRIVGNSYEMLQRDQDDARLNVAKHMGYFTVDKQGTSESEPSRMTDEQLDAVILSHASDEDIPSELVGEIREDAKQD
jgi:phage terminase small subunit